MYFIGHLRSVLLKCVLTLRNTLDLGITIGFNVPTVTVKNLALSDDFCVFLGLGLGHPAVIVKNVDKRTNRPQLVAPELLSTEKCNEYY